MKLLMAGVLLVGCTSEPVTGTASVTVSTGFPVASAYAKRAGMVIAFSGASPGTACAELAKRRSVDAYHDALVVQVAASDGTYPIGDGSGAASLSIYDDDSQLGGFDASAGFHAGSITVDWGDDAVTGTIDAHGSSAQTSDLVVSGTFDATYCP